MSSLTTWFSWSVSKPSDELPSIFPMPIAERDFIAIDVENIFLKILTDVSERTHGLKDDQKEMLFDSCLASENEKGLISLLAESMTNKSDLFLVIDSGVLRKATASEQVTIKADYKKQAYSSVGIYISFSKYIKTDMIKLYSALQYCTVSSLNKSMNVSKAIQFKMSDMRATVSLTDKAEVKEQALAIAKGIGDGKDAIIDAKDSIETAVPDLTAVKESIAFINQKMSFYLGLPESYITGIQADGLFAVGDVDQKNTERGLKSYYQSIIKPVFEALFKVKVSYKSQDFRQIESGLRALQAFDLASDELIPFDQKQKIINGLFDIEEKDQIEVR
jgi:hypothetical protein